MVKRTNPLRRWRRKPPDCDGWWRFREHGIRGEQRILVIEKHVASDDEWEQATGYAPDGEGSGNENYWEICSVLEMTDGTLTRGLWIFGAEVKQNTTPASVRHRNCRSGNVSRQ